MNTLDTIKEPCSEKGWNGYDTCLPISGLVLKRAKAIQPHIPKDFELFPGGDNSVQWESKDNNICIEVYEDIIYISSELDLEDSIPYYILDDAINRIQKFRSDVC